jgi:disulfide bond formation protein DsbB
MLLRRFVNLLGFLICAAMIAFAYYLQLGPPQLHPCPLCIFERIAVAALGVVFLIAFLHHPRARGRWVYVLLILIVAGIGIYIAARHVYIQMHPEAVISCGRASLKTMLAHMPFTTFVQQVLQGSGECAHVDKWLGFTLPGWVLGITCVLGVGGIAANARK